MKANNKWNINLEVKRNKTQVEVIRLSFKVIKCQITNWCLWIRRATYYAIQHFALCLITLQSLLPLLPFVICFPFFQRLIQFFFVIQCSFASHLQHEVHDTPADQQLQLALEHGGTDLHPQETSSNNSLEQPLYYEQVRECPLPFSIQTWKG